MGKLERCEFTEADQNGDRVQLHNLVIFAMGYTCRTFGHSTEREVARIGEELKSTFENEQQKAMLNVLFTANWFKSDQVKLFKPFDISPQQYNILRILRGAKEKMNMHCVKDRMIDRAPNATRLTDKLIAKDLVVRERCESDRRVVFVSIGPKGSKLLVEIDKELQASMARTIEHLTQKDALELNRILDTLRG